MTILVGAASPDGIVLGADSRMTLSDGQRHRIASDSTDKLFELDGRFGVATYGIAFVGQRTINGLMDEFIAGVNEGDCPDVETFANALGSFFHGRFEAQFGESDEQGWHLGFVVAGYDESGIGHVWEVGVPGPAVLSTSINSADLGVLWRGQTDSIARLIKGVDLTSLQQATEVDDELSDALARLEYILLHPSTLQDAADMVSFLVRTTIDMQRFSDGTGQFPGLVPGCGGQTQLLAVTRSGVEWISKRPLVGPSQPGFLGEGSVQ